MALTNSSSLFGKFFKSVSNFKILYSQVQIFRKYAIRCPKKKPNKFEKKLTIKDVPLEGKKVLMRVDFNVPMKDGKITSTQRIVASIPTIKYAMEKGAKTVVLMSHLGRPNGQKNKKFTLKPVAPVLNKLLGKKVCFIEETCSKNVIEVVDCAPKGSVFLLENLRFHAEETGKGVGKDGKKIKAKPEKVKEFRSCLSKLGNVFINDAFGTAHRPHSSMLGDGYKTRAAGLLLMKELKFFGKLLHNPGFPFLAILGGAKVTDKLPLIMSMLDRVNEMIIGGGMAFTFLKVLHKIDIGASLFDKKGAKLVPKIMKEAKKKGVLIHLPVDVVTAPKLSPKAKGLKIVNVKSGISKPHMGLDIGPKTIAKFSKPICRAEAIVWNGPPGVFEMKPFENGTKAMMDLIIESTKRGAITVIGGGDTAAACLKFKADKKVSHVSTGGGASLELLEGKDLPGVMALSDKKKPSKKPKKK